MTKLPLTQSVRGAIWMQMTQLLVCRISATRYWWCLSSQRMRGRESRRRTRSRWRRPSLMSSSSTTEPTRAPSTWSAGRKSSDTRVHGDCDWGLKLDNFLRWIAYSHVDFSGNQYILEKGFYNNCADWGSQDNRICSVQPILMVGPSRPLKHHSII